MVRCCNACAARRFGRVRLCKGVGLAFTLGVLIILGVGIGASIIVYERVRGVGESPCALGAPNKMLFVVCVQV